MTNVVDTPYFVDSKYTMGIQLTDLVAGVIRQYQEAELYRDPHTSDPYLRAIARYYRIIESKTMDLSDPQGYPLRGIYLMAEHLHYFDPEDEATSGGHLKNQSAKSVTLAEHHCLALKTR